MEFFYVISRGHGGVLSTKNWLAQRRRQWWRMSYVLRIQKGLKFEICNEKKNHVMESIIFFQLRDLIISIIPTIRPKRA